MARKHEAAQLLISGFSPSQIARRMGVSILTVLPYLCDQIGFGRIRRSDVVFSIDPAVRSRGEAMIANYKSDRDQDEALKYRLFRSNDPASEDVAVYLTFRDARVARGDLYEFITAIEIALHERIRSLLIEKYGTNEWWSQAIPVEIRTECERRMSRSPNAGAEPYMFTTFGHLRRVFDDHWASLNSDLPKSLFN